MLDLQARVHFQKIKIVMFVDEKFDGARVGVATGACKADRGIAHALAQFGGHDRRRSFFDNFLMAALYGTFAFAKRNDAAVSVSQNLNLDVTRFLQIFFEVHAGVAEGVQRFRRSVAKARGEFAVVRNETHAFAAAAGNGFEQNRIAYAAGEFLRMLRIVYGIVGAGNGGNFGTAGELAPGGFCAERFHGFGAGTDEGDSGFGARARERGVFRQKSVAGMNGVAAGALGDVHDFVDAQIAFAGRRGPDGIGFVGEADVQGVAVGFAENDGGSNAEFAASAQDAHGDFAAIGDEDLTEHG